MKKVLFALVAAVAMFMSSCTSTKVLTPSYNLANEPVEVNVKANLQVGGQVTATVEYLQLGMMIVNIKHNGVKCTKFLNVSSGKGLSRMDKLAKAKAAVNACAVEGTNYDFVVAPIYTLETKNGFNYKMTVKGYGAKVNGVSAH